MAGGLVGGLVDRGPISRFEDRLAGFAGRGEPICLRSFDFSERLLGSVAEGGARRTARCETLPGLNERWR
jgi:hypothetical protein